MMKYSDLRAAPRLDLNTAVPLPAPLCLYVEPTNVCNFRCSMCPESMHGYAQEAGYYGRMGPDCWHRILRDLRDWNIPLKSLKFYFEGEPLLNKDLPIWIAEARLTLPFTRLELTTNLSVLDRLMASRLVASGLDYVRISVYEVDDKRHAAVTGAAYSASDILDRARLFREVRDSVGARRPFLFAQYFAGAYGSDEFREKWGPVVDEVGFEPLHNWGGDIVVPVDSLTASTGLVVPVPRLPCPAPFYMMTIHADGSVSACCVDWASKLKIGSVLDSHLWEIWNGERLGDIQNMHILGLRNSIPACAACSAVFPDRIEVRGLVAGSGMSDEGVRS